MGHVMYILALEPAAYLSFTAIFSDFQLPFLRKIGFLRFVKASLDSFLIEEEQEPWHNQDLLYWNRSELTISSPTGTKLRVKVRSYIVLLRQYLAANLGLRLAHE